MGSNWKSFSLTDLYDIRSGLSKPRSEFGFGHGFLTFKDVLDNYFVPEKLGSLVNSTEKERESVSVMRGDVFLTRTSETQEDLGMSSVALNDYEGATFNGFTKRLRPKPHANIVPEYAAYYFRGPQFRREVTAMSSMSTRASLNNGMIERLTITLPPVEVQAAIGACLKALDDKIELNRRMNATLEGLARALFKSWFVDFDPVRAKMDGREPHGLPPATAALFPDSFNHVDGELIPSGWQIKTLEELSSHIGSGATPRGGSKVYVDEGVALVRSQNVFDFKFVWDGLARITPDAADALSSVALEQEDILFNITGASVLRTCVVDPAVLPARVNQHVLRIRAKSHVSSRFLHLHLVRQDVKDHLIGFNAGATREAVTKGHLQSVRLTVPSQGIMTAFADEVAPIYRRKQINLRESETLASLRDTLLPRMLSGELHVADASVVAGGTL